MSHATDNHDDKRRDPNRLLRETEAAEFLGYSVRALQNWRLRGGGPLFVRVSSRSIRYRFCDLLDWSQQRLVASTSDRPRLSKDRTVRATHKQGSEKRRSLLRRRYPRGVEDQ